MPRTELTTNRSAMLTSVLMVIGIAALLPYRHFLSDDGYIYLRFIRNFTETGLLSYNLPNPTYGFTGPLWVLIAGGLNYLISDPLLTIKIMAFVLSGVAIGAYFHLSLRFVKHEGYAVLATLALVLDPWFAKWMLSGLENPLTLSVVFCSLILHLRTRGTGRTSIVAYVLAGAGVLARPEMALFVGVLLLDVLLFEPQKRFQKFFLASLCAGLPVLLWLAYAQLIFGTFIPNTITAKRIEANWRSSHLETFIRCAKLIAGSSVLPVLALLGLGAVKLKEKELNRETFSALLRQYFAPATWCVGLVAFYVVGKATVSGRYLLAMIPILTLLGVVALEALIARMSPPRLRPTFAVAFGGLLAAQLVFLQVKFTYFVTEWEQGMDPNLIQMATWLHDNTPEDTIVAAHEIGVLGYFSERTVLDWGGLASEDVIPHLHDSKELWSYIRSVKPDYVLTIGPFTELTDAKHEVILTRDIRREGSSAIGKPKDTYYLTRLTYPSAEDYRADRQEYSVVQPAIGEVSP